MIDKKQCEKTINALMGEKRFKHSVNVAEMALTLANRFGCDEEKTYIAAIYHDVRKEADKDEMLSEVRSSGFYVDPVELDTFKLWHGIAGAYYAKNVLKIEDSDILNAIRFHTVGRAHMSKLEKIVFLADMVSEERSYEGVEEYRKIVLDNLDNGMFKTLQWSIMKTTDAGNKIPITTLEAYNYYNQFKK